MSPRIGLGRWCKVRWRSLTVLLLALAFLPSISCVSASIGQSTRSSSLVRRDLLRERVNLADGKSRILVLIYNRGDRPSNGTGWIAESLRQLFRERAVAAVLAQHFLLTELDLALPRDSFSCRYADLVHDARIVGADPHQYYSGVVDPSTAMSPDGLRAFEAFSADCMMLAVVDLEGNLIAELRGTELARYSFYRDPPDDESVDERERQNAIIRDFVRFLYANVRIQ
jgi:hypothetical protein